MEFDLSDNSTADEEVQDGRTGIVVREDVIIHEHFLTNNDSKSSNRKKGGKNDSKRPVVVYDMPKPAQAVTLEHSKKRLPWPPDPSKRTAPEREIKNESTASYERPPSSPEAARQFAPSSSLVQISRPPTSEEAWSAWDLERHFDHCIQCQTYSMALSLVDGYYMCDEGQGLARAAGEIYSVHKDANGRLVRIELPTGYSYVRHVLGLSDTESEPSRNVVVTNYDVESSSPTSAILPDVPSAAPDSRQHFPLAKEGTRGDQKYVIMRNFPHSIVKDIEQRESTAVVIPGSSATIKGPTSMRKGKKPRNQFDEKPRAAPDILKPKFWKTYTDSQLEAVADLIVDELVFRRSGQSDKQASEGLVKKDELQRFTSLLSDFEDSLALWGSIVDSRKFRSLLQDWQEALGKSRSLFVGWQESLEQMSTNDRDYGPVKDVFHEALGADLESIKDHVEAVTQFLLETTDSSAILEELKSKCQSVNEVLSNLNQNLKAVKRQFEVSQAWDARKIQELSMKTTAFDIVRDHLEISHEGMESSVVRSLAKVAVLNTSTDGLICPVCEAPLDPGSFILESTAAGS